MDCGISFAASLLDTNTEIHIPVVAVVNDLNVFEAEPDGLLQGEPEGADAPPLAADTFAVPVVMVESDVCHRKMCYICVIVITNMDCWKDLLTQ